MKKVGIKVRIISSVFAGVVGTLFKVLIHWVFEQELHDWEYYILDGLLLSIILFTLFSFLLRKKKS